MTKICSITITSDRHLIIRDALESVKNHVDKFLFVDLGIDPVTMAVIGEVCGNNTAFTACSDQLSMGGIRNRGLALAASQGMEWAIQLDTDERIVFPNNFIEILNNSDIDVFSSIHKSGRYSKERVFRIPAKANFVGHIHEQWNGTQPALMQGLVFDELPKSEETITKNLVSMVSGLKQQMADEPDNYRWSFQLALCYRAMDDPCGAIGLLQRALLSGATGATHAWICYTVAMCYMDLFDTNAAMEWCLKGLGRHPGLSELSHLAGVCCLKMGRAQEAMCWANMAISNGLFYGSSFAENRTGHREPYALWDGPFELQRDAMKAMGYPEEAITESDNIMQEARKRRHQ